MIVILSGVSGVGKTTLAQMLEEDEFVRSISYTTREKRAGEENKIDYFFITKTEFESKLKENYFLEYTNVFDNFYGTAYESIEQNLKENKKIIMCLTKEGFLAAKKKWGNIVLGVYLLPPDFETLKKRLALRNTNDYEERLRILTKTINSGDKENFDVSLKANEDILETFANLKNLINAHKEKINKLY